MTTSAQDDQPIEIKTDTPADICKTIAKVEAYQQRRQAKPDDEAIAKLEAVAQKRAAVRSTLRDLKTTIISKYIAEYCYELYPNGYPAARGGYCCVPTPILNKISYESGLVFNLEDPESRHPMTDPETGRRIDIVDLWMWVKGRTFRETVRDLQRWVEEKENGTSSPELPRDHEYYWESKAGKIRDLKREVLVGVFWDPALEEDENAPITTKKRGSARQFWKVMQKHFGENWKFLCEDYPEFLSSAPRFLQLLQYWSDARDSEYFSVKTHSRSKNITFTLSLSIEESEESAPIKD